MKRNFTIILLLLSSFVMGQGVITGSVSDEDSGESMPGVNIIVKGMKGGAVTDLNGNFNIKASKGDTLIFSFMGYHTKEVGITNQVNLKITLSLENKTLDEFVVVGYGIQRKSDVTGAVAKIGSEDFEETHSSSIGSIMQGRAAGVTVTTASGSPGKDPEILVRGISSINGTPPLWVVDGVPISGTINPQDIESMEILKDASAAAIYGTRAAGGVILITTKKGKKGKMNLNYENRFGLGQFPKYLDLTPANEWSRLRTEAYENASLPVPPSLGEVSGEGTDWQKEISQNAFSQNHFLSAAGGSDKVQYYMSMNYGSQEGIIQKSDAKNTSFRINTTAQVNDWLKLGENLSIGGSDIHAVNEEDEWNAVLIEAISIDPVTQVKKDDGSWDGSKYNTVANPVAHLDRTKGQNKEFSIAGDISAEIKFLKDFTLTSRLGINKYSSNFYDWTPTFFVKVGEENSQTSVSRDYNQSFDWVSSTYLTWYKEIKKHHIMAMAGYEAQQITSEWFGTSATNLITENKDNIYIDNATGNQQAASYGLGSEITMASTFGRLNYSYDSRYFATVNMRYQSSSKFGYNKRGGLFPSASIGWALGKEEFMQNAKWLDNLKIRAGYGITGNAQSLEPYSFIGTTNTGQNYVIGGQITSGVSLSRIPNPDLHWEEKSTINVGIDAYTFGNKLSFTGDFFIDKTDGMILAVALPGHVGAEQAPFQNVASMRNVGFEMNIGYKNRDHKLKYDLVLNFSHVKNTVTDLGSTGSLQAGSFMQMGYISRTETGQSMAFFYGYVTDGLFQNQAEVNAHTRPNGSLIQPNAKPGDIRYKADENGNLLVENIGSPFPDFTIGLNTRLQYGRFSLLTFIYGVYGNEIFNASKFYTHNSSVRYNVSNDLKDRWLMEGDTDDPNLARLNISDANNSLRSDRFIEDGSYLRLKNIQLEYTFDKDHLAKLAIASLRLFIGVENAFTLTHYSGFDPEIGIYNGRPLDRGIDRAQYPNPRVYYCGLSIQL
jgi:TonB-linked SusC/RagA family outer membrane protein